MLWGVDYVWTGLFLAVMGGLWYVAYRIEPHYASKDGTRFMCGAQEMEPGSTPGRTRETRVSVSPDGVLYVSQKKMGRRETTTWTVTGTAPEPPKAVKVYVARRVDDGRPQATQLFLRIPHDSRTVPVLDALLAAPGDPQSN